MKDAKKKTKFFKEFNNEQICMMFFMVRAINNSYEEVLKKRGHTQTIDHPAGPIQIFQPIPEDVLGALETSVKRKHFTDIFDKLEPIVDMIKWGDPDTYEQLEQDYKDNGIKEEE